MKTVLEIAADMAPHCGIDAPALLVASQEQNAIDIVRCLNEAGAEMETRFDWPELRKSQNFVGAGNVLYDLPADFSRFIKGTQILTSTNAIVRGSLSDDEFNRLTPVAGLPRYYRASTKKIEFWPYVDAPANVAITYLSRNWLTGDKSVIDNDGLEPLFSDESLRKAALWRWRRMKGLDFKDWLDESEADFARYSSFARMERN